MVLEKWKQKITSNIKKIKVNPLEDAETEYVDLDIILNYYVDEYRTIKKDNQRALLKGVDKILRSIDNRGKDINMKDVKEMIVNFLPAKSPSTSVQFPREITFYRAYVYALVCGDNNKKVTKQQFIAGCNRFGVDNPCPIITKRLSIYGNTEEMVKEFKRAAE